MVHHITIYFRIVADAPWSPRRIFGEVDSDDTSNQLSGVAIRPTVLKVFGRQKYETLPESRAAANVLNPYLESKFIIRTLVRKCK